MPAVSAPGYFLVRFPLCGRSTERCRYRRLFGVSLPLGVTGNTSDSGSEESRFETWRGNFTARSQTTRPGCLFSGYQRRGSLIEYLAHPFDQVARRKRLLQKDDAVPEKPLLADAISRVTRDEEDAQ